MYIPSYSTGVRLTDPYNNFTSTSDTINQMIGIVQSSLNDPWVHGAVQDIQKKLGSFGHTREKDICRAIWWYVKSHISFVTDEETLVYVFGYSQAQQERAKGMELLISPGFLLQMESPVGDCDDFSMLIATLLMCFGITQVYFCTVAASANDPSAFSHVFVKVGLKDGSYFPLDASHGKYPGWETNQQYSVADWPITQAAATTSVQTTPVQGTSTGDPFQDYNSLAYTGSITDAVLGGNYSALLSFL